MCPCSRWLQEHVPNLAALWDRVAFLSYVSFCQSRGAMWRDVHSRGQVSHLPFQRHILVEKPTLIPLLLHALILPMLMYQVARNKPRGRPQSQGGERMQLTQSLRNKLSSAGSPESSSHNDVTPANRVCVIVGVEGYDLGALLPRTRQSLMHG